MFGKKYRDMDAIEKHHHKNQKAIYIRGLVIFLGVVYSGKMIMNPDQVSEFNSEIWIHILIAGYFFSVIYSSDKNKFSETRQIKSFTWTFICLGVILFNIGLYFYLL